MTIYLGSSGHIELQRPTTEWLRTTVNNSDINVDKRRFSVNFYGDQNGAGALADNPRRAAQSRDQAEDSLYNFITGDRITIRSVSRNNLAFLADPAWPDGKPHRAVTKFVHVDPAGGMRLYDDFADALSGTKKGAVELQDLDETLLDPNVGPDGHSEVDNKYQLVEMRGEKLGSKGWRCLGQVTSYEIVTERENIDITALNQAYRQQYEAGIIQGSGRISAFWEHELSSSCDETDDDNPRNPEVSAFLAAIILRLEQGADFGARFYLTEADNRNSSQSLWYDCPKCVVTNCTVSVEPTQIITADIDFVTSGKVRLKQGFPVDLLLEEKEVDYIIDEQDGLPFEMQNSSDN